MLHLSFAWFALLLIIGARILINDQIKYVKYLHDRDAHKAEWKEKIGWGELVPHKV